MSTKLIIFTIITLILLLAFAISVTTFRQDMKQATVFSQANDTNDDNSTSSAAAIATADDDKKPTMIMNLPRSATEAAKKRGRRVSYIVDISEFDPSPAFISIIGAKNDDKEEKSIIRGWALVKYIQRNLFKDFRKGYFEFDTTETNNNNNKSSLVSLLPSENNITSSSSTKEEQEDHHQQQQQQRQKPTSTTTSSSASSIFFGITDSDNDDNDNDDDDEDETGDKKKKKANQQWEPLTCLDKSTLPCRKMTGAGGPLQEYYPRFNNRPLFRNYCCGCSDKGRWIKPFAPNAFDVLSSSDISIKKLLKRIIEWEGSSSSSSSSKQQQQQYPSSSSSSLLDDILKILSHSGKNQDAQQLLEQLYIVLGRNMHSKIVKTEQSKLMLLLGLSRLKKVNVDVLEPTVEEDANNNNNNNNNTHDDPEFIRRYKKAEQEEQEREQNNISNNNNNNTDTTYTPKKQKAARVFIPGNSYVRALPSSIASIFRGQTRYFDRGSHGTVRYVVTNLGDYYWIEDTAVTEERNKKRRQEEQKQEQSTKTRVQQDVSAKRVNNQRQNGKKATKSTRETNRDDEKEKDNDDASADDDDDDDQSDIRKEDDNENDGPSSSSSSILPPIRLRKKGEVVFFEIVFRYQIGMLTRSPSSKSKAKKKTSSAKDFFVESPLLSPKVQAREFRGPFSAVFMRYFVFHDAFHKFYGDQGLEDYCKWQMKTVMKQQQKRSSKEEFINEEKEKEEDFYVALHASPEIQYLSYDKSPTSLYAKYELQYGKPAFEKERDELLLVSSSSSSSSSPRHVFIPKPVHQRGEVFTVVDPRFHTQCILLPHYPAVGKGLQPDVEKVNKNNDGLMKWRYNNNEDDNVVPPLGLHDSSDCSDVLSRNYLFKFAFGALMSAKSTRKQLMRKDKKYIDSH